MPDAIEIAPGGQFEKDPYDKTVLHFDWDSHLDEGVELLTSGEFIVSSITEPAEDPITLEVDSVALLAGNRVVQFRLIGGVANHAYDVAHRVEFSSDPGQQRERHFVVWVHD